MVLPFASDSVEIDDLRKGDVLAIRSLRNLQELGKVSSKSSSHRKFADF